MERGNPNHAPAARLGDITSCPGVIISGYPTVLIGMQPASRMGADWHTCVPLVFIPTPIAEGEFTVLIGSMPAARIGDQAPPSNIVTGCFTVFIGDS